MEENRILERMWREAQQVEIPPELLPEQMQKRICEQQKTPHHSGNQNENKNGSKSENKNGDKGTSRTLRMPVFHWHGYGSRVAAAAVVLAVSLGTFALAGRQTLSVGDHADGVTVSDHSSQLTTKGEEPSGADDSAGTLDGSESQDEEENLISVTELGDYHQASGYEEVGRMFGVSQNDYANGTMMGWELTEGAAVDDSVSASRDTEKQFAVQDSAGAADTADVYAGEDFSTTNLQVEGVDESDIVKTDGHYIYIASEREVRIVDTADGQVRQLGSITPKFEGNLDTIREMYVSGDRLILIVQKEDTEQIGEDTSYVTGDVAFISNQRMHTEVLTYDISSPAGAQLTGTFEQDGTYNTSRKIGDRVYLFTNYYVDTYQLYAKLMGQPDDAALPEGGLSSRQTRMYPGEKEVQTVLPKVQGETIPSDCIYLPERQCQGGIVIASFDVYEPETVCDRKLIFSGYSTMYVTQDSVILYRSDYSEAVENTTTALTKFRIRDGQIIADCAESVVGEIYDTFAIHESAAGDLYVLTTDYETNQLFVLDKKLKIKGRIDHIADGETVYAARFVDDIGYFVTYRNMDPLFTVDFSDPTNPTLIGELEIPGFSDYLQFWDDTHLIGVGEERIGEDSEFIGMKLSLYDISDPTKVTESDKVVFKDAYAAPAAYNYKALLADSAKNVIAFLTDDERAYNDISERIYSVTDGRLQEQRTERVWEGDDYSRSSDDYRNVYIGDTLYLVCSDQIIAYDMSDKFARIGSYDLH